MDSEALRFQFSAMGSPCEFLLCATEREMAGRIAEAGIAEVKRIEQKYSRYRPDSVISAVNAAAGSGHWTACDDETIWLLNFAATLYENSDGLFDITSGVLRRVWNFEQGKLPTEEELANVLPLIDWQAVDFDGKSIRLPRPGMEIDFGGFGKEYAADAAAARLQKMGIRHGYVNLGGDIRVIGPQPSGAPWEIAIQDPREREEIVATIPVYQGGLATSGDYEKFFLRDGLRYCHILDPRNGMPVTYWRSVSIAAPLAIVAGSCSTITMLRQEEGRDWLKKSGFSYLAIAGDGSHLIS